MHSLEEVKTILAGTLSLGERKQLLTADTGLLGNLPEFDSLAVMHVIASLEEHFGIALEDDEITADIFATVGTLATLVDRKTGR